MYIIQRYIVFLQCSLQLLSYCWSSLPLRYILFAHCCIWAGVALSHAYALKIVSHFLYNSLLLQSISKHTNVAYIWRDTTSIYTWYISLVYCCIFCTLHPSTHHLFDCCIFIDRYHVKPKHPLISYDGVCLMAVLYTNASDEWYIITIDWWYGVEMAWLQPCRGRCNRDMLTGAPYVMARWRISFWRFSGYSGESLA